MAGDAGMENPSRYPDVAGEQKISNMRTETIFSRELVAYCKMFRSLKLVSRVMALTKWAMK
jgi:hypothetical protein